MTVGSPLRVGFLHVGRERSGLRRYGRILAAELELYPRVLQAFVERSARPEDAHDPLHAPIQRGQDLVLPDADH